MRVAAYQAPLVGGGTIGTAIGLIREQVRACEVEGVEILCCPEGILGGLADYVAEPAAIAIDTTRGELEPVLEPLASDLVTTIVGFTEIRAGRFFNAAAVFHRGEVVGLYRKLHPAINRSVYSPGSEVPVFTIGRLTFGIAICRDSTFAEPARVMATKGAAAMFVPTNNGLPSAKSHPSLPDEARSGDRSRALENQMAIVRADVAGNADGLVSAGSSAITAPDGRLLQATQPFQIGRVVAEVSCGPSPHR